MALQCRGLRLQLLKFLRTPYFSPIQLRLHFGKLGLLLSSGDLRCLKFGRGRLVLNLLPLHPFARRAPGRFILKRLLDPSQFPAYAVYLTVDKLQAMESQAALILQ
jgi:hypothetical protein